VAFGQAAGPPASAKQVARLVELLAEAGYDGLREARHPFGLTQRQANGKFTGPEASELIERLEAEQGTGTGEPAPDPAPAARPARRTPRAVPARRPPVPDPAPGEVAAAFPDELLAEELTRRGWTCTPPEP
jgi:hypothetical protein